MVNLSHSHIIVDNSVVQQLFPEAGRVSWVFYPAKNQLMIAGEQDELFKSLHKTSTTIFKLRNGKGDRSLDVLSVIIDHDIDDADRELKFLADNAMNVLNVYF